MKLSVAMILLHRPTLLLIYGDDITLKFCIDMVVCFTATNSNIETFFFSV